MWLCPRNVPKRYVQLAKLMQFNSEKEASPEVAPGMPFAVMSAENHHYGAKLGHK